MSKRPLDYDDSANKRTRLPPSRCIHVRNIPYDCTTNEIALAFAPYGAVTRAVKMSDKPQAIVEFADVSSAEAAVQQLERAPGFIRGRPFYVNFSRHDSIGNSSASAPGESQDLAPNSILLVKIANVMFPVNVSVLHQVFSPFGRILKIVIFQKTDTKLLVSNPIILTLIVLDLRALVQFESVQSAAVAKANLDTRDIYAGCCTLSISFSKLTTVTVKENPGMAHDFTVEPDIHNMGFPPGAMPPGPMGMPMGMGFGGPVPPFGFGGPGGPGNGGMSGHHGESSQPSTVVLVTGLAEGIMPDHLFRLFGYYGNVNRVKILFNKKENALVQFSSPQGANNAISFLNDCVIKGRPIKVNMSKHPSIAMPREQDLHSELTKDYSELKRFRYSPTNPKAASQICAPSAVLHISNIPPSMDEDELRLKFSEVGFVKGFQFMAGPKRMALIQMDSPEQAISGLITYHDMEIEGYNLRVSFSRSHIGSSN